MEEIPEMTIIECLVGLIEKYNQGIVPEQCMKDIVNMKIGLFEDDGKYHIKENAM